MSEEGYLEIPEGICALSYQPLDTVAITKSVADDRAGATALFIGTTRNYFKGVSKNATRPHQGKVVTRLEYQAYSKLALKTMSKIIEDTHKMLTKTSSHDPSTAAVTPAIIKCAVHHRLGIVPVGEPSIVVAVSSPHRKESFIACEHILEEVKSKVQVWKREFYEGEGEDTAEWKANAH